MKLNCENFQVLSSPRARMCAKTVLKLISVLKLVFVWKSHVDNNPKNDCYINAISSSIPNPRFAEKFFGLVR